jgi:hypothetical protein
VTLMKLAIKCLIALAFAASFWTVPFASAYDMTNWQFWLWMTPFIIGLTLTGWLSVSRERCCLCQHQCAQACQCRKCPYCRRLFHAPDCLESHIWARQLDLSSCRE